MLKTFSLLAVMLCSVASRAACLPITPEHPLPDGQWVIGDIQVIRHEVFDVKRKDTFWFHRFANRYHVLTKESTVRDDLLFTSGAPLALTELAETERLLRSRRYLRHAEVSIQSYCPHQNTVNILVESWDNWSLLPKIELGHEGGETKSALGFSQDNWMGSGNQLQAEYFNDSERDGFQLRFMSPNIFGKYWRTSMSYADNSDGESYAFDLEKPFYRFNSPRAYGLKLAKDIKTISEYALGDEINEYNSNAEFLELYTGWTLSQQQDTVQHLLVGASMDERTFTANNATIWPVPADRDLSQLWLGWEWIEADYQKLQNIFLFHRTEDINFGWQANLRLGRLQQGWGASTSGWQWRASLQKNWVLSEQSWLIFNSDYQQLDASRLPSQQRFGVHLRYIRHLTERQVWISQLRWSWGKNLFRDELTTLGGDDGMRAFPLYYQTGNKAVIASSEYRYITNWHVYQLFDVALAGFVDAGRAWDHPIQPNPLDQGTLYGYGIGLRILPSHSSRGSIISIDLAKPVSDNPDLSGWQWRLIAKREF